MRSGELQRSIGLWGAVGTTVGLVVGAGIFILPGQLAVTAGPGVFLSFLFAAVPALLGCLVYAELGSVFPVSGAMYVAVSQMLSPRAGFLLAWTLVAAFVMSNALLAYGFADYLAFFVPQLPRRVVALSSVVAFSGLNILGAALSVRTQTVMVAGFILVLLVFGLGGIVHIDFSLMTPFLPNGLSAVALAAVPAFFSFLGFFIIVELGGEVKQPARIIPLALGISFVCVLFFYTLTPFVLTGLISWTELGDTAAPVGTAASLFLPSGIANIIALGALLATATSINGGVLAPARDVYALARDDQLPTLFGHVHPRFNTPVWAIVAIGSVTFLAVLLGTTITQYAMLTVLGAMIVQILVALAVLRFPTHISDRLRQTDFTLIGWLRVLACGGLIVYSLGFFVYIVLDNPLAAGGFLAVLVLGGVYYHWRQGSAHRAHSARYEME